MEFIVEHAVVILAFLLALSEILALIPSIKSSSVFQLIVAALKKIKDVVIKKEEVKAE
jgi:MFS superfamily sulfate permease-like transporter